MNLDRINELARKQREVGLTEEEKRSKQYLDENTLMRLKQA